MSTASYSPSESLFIEFAPSGLGSGASETRFLSCFKYLADAPYKY